MDDEDRRILAYSRLRGVLADMGVGMHTPRFSGYLQAIYERLGIPYHPERNAYQLQELPTDDLETVAELLERKDYLNFLEHRKTA